MAIKVSRPTTKEEVDFVLDVYEASLLKRIYNSLGVIDAIRVLRLIHPKCGYTQAKEFVQRGLWSVDY